MAKEIKNTSKRPGCGPIFLHI